MMGFVYESRGANGLSVEERGESFYIHPGYGYDDSGNDHSDLVIIDGERVERAAFADHWRSSPHPEFLLSDVPALIEALADLPTCPQEIKSAVEEIATKRAEAAGEEAGS